MNLNLSSYQLKTENDNLLEIHLVPTRLIWFLPFTFFAVLGLILFVLITLFLPPDFAIKAKVSIGLIFLFACGFLTRNLTMMMTSHIRIDLKSQKFEAIVWSKSGKQAQRFELRKVGLIRIESHGPICLLWLHIREQGGTWILAWGLSTGEGLRLQEKLTAFLRKNNFEPEEEFDPD